jgi:SSS family solute:Na+ symporter
MVSLSLSGWDFAAVGLMAAGILTLGFSVRLRENTTLQLLAAGRNLTLPLFVATLVTTWYGGILGVGEAFDYFGLSTWVLLGLPYYLFGFAYAFLLAPRIRRERAISLPEQVESKFGKGAGALVALLLLFLGAPAAHVFMLGTLVSMLTGWDLIPSILVGAVGGTLFLYKGGLLADARSNLLCFTMMYASFALIVVLSFLKYGAPDLTALPPDHRSWDAGRGIGYVIGWILIGAWTFVDPGFHQRVTSAENATTARRGVLVSVGFWMLFDLLSVTTAWYAFQALGAGRGTQLFPAYADAMLPDGAKGFFLAGVFGVIVSALVGYTLVTGGTIGRDLLGRLMPSEPGRVALTRLGIALATLIGIGLALAIQSVVNIWYDVAGIVIPGLLFPTVASYVGFPRLCSWSAAASSVLGSGAALVWYVLQRRGTIPTIDEGGVIPLYVGLACAAVPAIVKELARLTARGR